MKKVYVVIISELTDVHANEVDAETFASHDGAVSWIEKQIAEKVDICQLEESEVDGWCVEIDGSSHAIRYDLRGCALR